jgi:SulP family sulfate permease
MLAGLTAATVVIPKAMGYAVIAGVPVEAGLYTAMAAMFIYPLFGTSRALSVSTTSTLAMMTATQVAATPDVSPAAVAVTLAMLVGIFLILARLLKLGYVANFVSKPVLIGFEAGIGVVIIVGQLKSLLGVHLTAKSTVGILLELPQTLGNVHGATVVVGLAGIALMVALHRLYPRVSAPLALVVLSIMAAAWLHLEAMGVKLAGAVPTGLPSLVMPDLSLALRLWPGALGIALMSFTESVASARTFSRREDPRVDSNRELLAIGAANVASAFVGGFAAGGGASQTAINDQAGARSQLAQLFSAAIVVVCLLFLSRVVGLLPQAALGALIVVSASSMIKPEGFRAIQRIRMDELIWALITMAGVILIGTLQGILIAVAVSVFTIMYHANHPPVYAIAHNREKSIFRRVGENDKDVTYPGLLMLRTEGRISFANAENAADKMRALMEEAHPRVIVLDCSAIPDIEYTALVMLTEAEQKQREQGVKLWLAALPPDLLKLIERSPLGITLGHDRMFFNLDKAVEAYQAMPPDDTAGQLK